MPPLPLLLLFLLCIPLVQCLLSSPDASPLLSFKSSADPSDHLLFPPRSPTPCQWTGVSCSPAARVTRLVLESLALNGTFPDSTLGRLDQLRILSLKFNSLAGTVPDLSNLTNLKALYLDHNHFSGPFPPSLLSLHRLRTLDLSNNFFTGSLPIGLTGLERLLVLQLESNRFVGTVPAFNQSSLKSFNMSTNNLTGPVPATSVLSTFGSSAFVGNPGLCGEVVRRECSSHISFFPHGAAKAPSPGMPPSRDGSRQGFLLSQSSTTPSKSPHKRAILAIGFMSAAIFLIAFFTLILAVRKMKRAKITGHGKIQTPDKSTNGSEQMVADDPEEPTTAMIMDLPEEKHAEKEKAKTLGKSGCLTFCAGEAPGYNLEQLMKASAEMLGRGSVGATYKAVLDNRMIVCVKRLDAGRIGLAGKEDFERHMEAAGRLRHPNLVPLRAYFHAKEERLLVYDYQPNGSLYSLLHGSKSSRAKPLHWTSCLKIAEDIAQGLSYIHQASRLVHGNIKSSNVLLGPDFEACLADCCLSLLVDEQFTEPEDVSRFYRAPEARESNRNLTPRSDIYAYGVLLLELLTGKSPLDHHDLVSKDLPSWVRSVREEGESVDDERLTMIVDIAAICIRLSPESRPTAWQVLKMIQEVKEAETGDGDDDSDLSARACHQYEPIQVSCPSLFSLRICSYLHGGANLLFKNMKFLKVATIILISVRKHFGGGDVPVLNFLGSLSNATKLSLYIGSPELKAPLERDILNYRNFNNVKELSIRVCGMNFDFNLLASMLKLSPNVEKLTSVLDVGATHEEHMKEVLEDVLFQHKYIEMVKIRDWGMREVPEVLMKTFTKTLNAYVKKVGNVVIE